jgi:hypothetical protein
MKTTKMLRIVSQVLLASSSIAVYGQLADLPYDSGSTGVDGALTFRSFLSPGRNYSAMAYDGTRQEMVVFGGQTGLGDTWTFNGTAWTLKTSPQAPRARYGQGMTFDGAHNQVVLYGGYQSDGGSNDTWIWDGTNWQQKNPAQSPPKLYHPAMVFDEARGQVLLFGGYEPARGAISETWLWDGETWTKAAPATSPGARYQHTLAYDAERQKVVLFGSHWGGYTDTWTWDGTTWTQATPLNRPPGLSDAAMTYDSQRKQVILYGGSSWEWGGARPETWAWNGTDWAALNTTDTPAGRSAHAMAYDPVRQQLVVVGGNQSTETFILKSDNDWDLWSANYAVFDMTSKPDGIWNYTTIDIPAGLTLYFKPNSANTPVRWLASGNVTINGFVNVNGQNGLNAAASNQNPGNEAPGGPGGYAGGLGAVRFDQSSSYTGSPGQGPGGGSPGVGASDGYNNAKLYGQQGAYAGTYGNAYIQPLLGGSGGGGAGSGYSGNGGNGGGGGGAILIASKRDIVVNGGIFANGGQPGSNAGAGSGGAIRLIADRINGGGRLEANGGGAGRIRVEAFYRSLVGNSSPVASISAPVLTRAFDSATSLIISKVAGQNVSQPPTGSTTAPDVIFTSSGEITVEVQAQDIPNNTPVRLRVTTANGVIEKPAQDEPAVTLAAGKATFALTVPAGLGTIQAFAEFTVNQ